MFMKGAFIQFADTILGPLPNVIVFQFNPEKITHTWSAASQDKTQGTQGAKGDPLAVFGMPGQTFSFTIKLDANDQIIEGGPVTAALAELSGVYSRLAALEMLLIPVSKEGSPSGGSGEANVAIKQVPMVLFVWGPGRIVPVRVTQLTITETLFDRMLNPVHADVDIQLSALSSEDLANATGALADLAKFAALYSSVSREALAAANLANAAESLIGMLPV